MSEYIPDSWAILKVTNQEGVMYKVLGGWSGGYLCGDSWRINSGICTVGIEGDYYLFVGHTGSVYKCHKDNERVTMAMAPYGDLVSLDDVEHIPAEQLTEEICCE